MVNFVYKYLWWKFVNTNLFVLHSTYWTIEALIFKLAPEAKVLILHNITALSISHFYKKVCILTMFDSIHLTVSFGLSVSSTKQININLKIRTCIQICYWLFWFILFIVFLFTKSMKSTSYHEIGPSFFFQILTYKPFMTILHLILCYITSTVETIMLANQST